MDRITSAIAAWSKGTQRSRVFHEIHYYFICWDAVWKRLKVIKERSGFKTLKPILQKHRTMAEHYVMGRGQLEHYDEWLAGRPKYPPVANWDYGNLRGHELYTLTGREWDISSDSLRRLERLVREFSDAAMIEGIPKQHRSD